MMHNAARPVMMNIKVAATTRNAMNKNNGQTSTDRVRQALEKEIFTGQLRPGEKLDEEALAQRFKVSRTPVREAILQLVTAGLVDKRARQGAVVAPFNLHSMVQMFEIMSEIEALCCKFAARRMTDKERQSLRDIHVDLTRHCTELDLDAYYEANRRFHEAIYAGSHNPYLEDMARGLFVRLTPYRRYQLNRPERIEESCAEHGAIIDAIAASDTELAQQLMRKHVSIQAEVLGEFVSVMAN